MTGQILLLTIVIPLSFAVAILFIPRRFGWAIASLTVSAAFLNLWLALGLFKHDLSFSLPWAGYGMEFLLRLYHFSGFVLLAVAGFGFLIALYCAVFIPPTEGHASKDLNEWPSGRDGATQTPIPRFQREIGEYGGTTQTSAWGSMRNKNSAKLFYSYFLFTLAFENGAVLADNLVLMLFFWEGLLLTLFAMIAIGHRMAFKTATKAFIIVGIADLCLLVGVALAGYLAGTMTISKMSLSLNALGGIAFLLLMIGAVSKAGSMPFHSWIPDAALDAPLPFMAFLPAALEKLLGIYFLARITLDIFELQAGTWASTLLMTVGVLTILFAVMMALIQKNYKRLLSYHAISQVGYMILGIGTAVPAGIVGGLFHMINHALYKSGLFLTAGAVERQTGNTDLEKLGGLCVKMPVTLVCFFITAASISGVPPFNGFFSKELVYHGAMERGMVFYLAALLGSFLTAASFLKLGHAAFFGKRETANQHVKEAPLLMLIPMVVIALICVIFGIYNFIPLQGLIQPILGPGLQGLDFSGFHVNPVLLTGTGLALGLALLNHFFGFKRTGSGLKAADHIHHAPVLSWIYQKAEQRYFDPYNIGEHISDGLAKMAWALDRAVDWIYDGLTVKGIFALTNVARKFQNGNYSWYILWSLAGCTAVVVFLLKSL